MFVSWKSVRILNSYYIIFKIQNELYVILTSTGIPDVRAEEVHYLSRDNTRACWDEFLCSTPGAPPQSHYCRMVSLSTNKQNSPQHILKLGVSESVPAPHMHPPK